MQKIAVVILNFNGERLLEKFLPNVIKYSSDVAEVIVADNASTDDSVNFLKKNYPDIRVISNSRNEGFATGYNLALKEVEAEYFVLLNSDVEVTFNWIQPIIEYMDANKDVAACQPKILSWSDKSMFEYAGASGGYIDKYGYPFCRGRIFMDLEKDNKQYDKSTEVFWASGAALFIRSKLFHEVGGFDDLFFAHMEEIDLCWRLKHLGHKIMCIPDSVVYHVGGGTLNKMSSRKTYLNFRNNSILMLKNLPKKRFIWVIFYRLILDGVAGLKFLLEGNPSHTLAVIKAHLYVYKNWRMLIKKRKTVFREDKVSCIYKRNIVFDHYLRKKNKYSNLNKTEFS
ncbi:MAG: glycosyltransferase family 2 protein [Hyphomicrobiales bacterium]